MNPPPIPSDIDRPVIVCPSWVGDSVMATPLLRATRRQLPKAQITGVLRPGIDELLAGLRWFDGTAVVETKGLTGEIVNCRHVQGLLHEVSVKFDRAIDPSLFVQIDESQDAAPPEQAPPRKEAG